MPGGELWGPAGPPLCIQSCHPSSQFSSVTCTLADKATLAHLRCKCRLTPHAVLCFACVKVFAVAFDALVPDSWRVTNSKDIIPTVPRLLGYAHVKHGVRLRCAWGGHRDFATRQVKLRLWLQQIRSLLTANCSMHSLFDARSRCLLRVCAQTIPAIITHRDADIQPSGNCSLLTALWQPLTALTGMMARSLSSQTMPWMCLGRARGAWRCCKTC